MMLMVLMLKVSPPLHKHVHVYLKQGLRPLFQKLAVGLAELAVRPSVNRSWRSNRA
jgi:hypothetical protein